MLVFLYLDIDCLHQNTCKISEEEEEELTSKVPGVALWALVVNWWMGIHDKKQQDEEQKDAEKKKKEQEWEEQEN